MNGGNRGCEAIARSTAEIIGASKEDLIGLCTNIPLDTRLGLDKLYTLLPSKSPSYSFRIINKFYSLNRKDGQSRKKFEYSYYYNDFLNLVGSDDVMFSTGGDLMCYENCMANYTVDFLSERNKKTVLWGCSVGENNLTPEKIVSLNNFSAVVARESLTYKLFKDLGLKKVFLYPDPAFVLKPESCDIPTYMQEDEIIGVNLSNFVGYDVSENSIIGKNLRMLIAYILKQTSMKVVFFPHVLWNGQDDRIICNKLLEEFKNTNRIFVLDSEVYSYCQIRYLISKCEMFIAARTHAAISAYSTFVPTFALGYSVKSIGIVKDLGLPQESVVDAINVTSPNELAEGFAKFLKSKETQRNTLLSNIPNYVSKIKDMKGILNII